MTGSLLSLRSAFLLLESRITQGAVMLGCLGLVLASLAGFYQVLARFIFFQAAPWSEPFIQTVLIWMTYVALAGAMRTGTLISVDLLLSISTGRLKVAVRAATITATVGLLLVILWFGIALVWRVRFQTIAGLGVSASWAYAALPVGAGLSIFALIAHLIDPPARIDTATEAAG